jgi:hypothetical protein
MTHFMLKFKSILFLERFVYFIPSVLVKNVAKHIICILLKGTFSRKKVCEIIALNYAVDPN